MFVYRRVILKLRLLEFSKGCYPPLSTSIMFLFLKGSSFGSFGVVKNSREDRLEKDCRALLYVIGDEFNNSLSLIHIRGTG